jgi:hypothetical protein
MIRAFPHRITRVIASSIDLQDGAFAGQGRTYMQKNKKFAVVGN